jgi:hypothetical protein
MFWITHVSPQLWPTLARLGAWLELTRAFAQIGLVGVFQEARHDSWQGWNAEPLNRVFSVWPRPLTSRSEDSLVGIDK